MVLQRKAVLVFWKDVKDFLARFLAVTAPCLVKLVSHRNVLI